MKLSKNKVVFTFLASLAMSNVAFAETVNGGKVTFNGEVTSGACAVSGSDTDKLVTLDTVRADRFTQANQLGNAKKAFEISLLDCDASTLSTVQVSFNGQGVDGNSTLLGNSAGAGAAENVGLQLFGPDGAALNINDLSSTVNLIANTTIPLSVDYMSTAAAVTAGKVQSVANFQLSYN
ncbi:TPA: fimbrial protein [Serratia fonticola]|nr:fimbrial protein [Serratia fonticola]